MAKTRRYDIAISYKIVLTVVLEMNIAGVEFKSLPSGLHNVNEDLVYTGQVNSGLMGRYFVMPPYAGLSAYYKKDDPESERNARMVAIGVLVPSTGRYGRLGRAWNHASQLKSLAQYYIPPGFLELILMFRSYADNPDDTSHLQLYFENYYDPSLPTSAYPTTPITPSTPRYVPKHLHSQVWRDQTLRRKRSVSDTAVPFRGLKLSVTDP